LKSRTASSIQDLEIDGRRTWSSFEIRDSTIRVLATQIKSANAVEVPMSKAMAFGACLEPDSELRELAKIADSSAVSVCAMSSKARASKAGSS
jgi:hypothetical protein